MSSSQRRVPQVCWKSTAAHYNNPQNNHYNNAWKKQQQPSGSSSPSPSPSTSSGGGWTQSSKKQWGRPRQQQQQQQQQIRRVKPQRYNSLVFLPDTVTLRYPTTTGEKDDWKKKNKFSLNCIDFAISKPGKGGHVLLARNGSGKSLLVNFLSHPEFFLNDMATEDDYDDWVLSDPSRTAYVSFESHLQVLKEQPHVTVHDHITGGTGNLSKAAKYLVVRFGLKPLLHRTLSTLSTGEIRKSLLVSALSKEPDLVILENPFDGLDVPSRSELKSIVSKTIQGLGKSGKLLVTHVNSEYVPPAQVFMSTHRPEEIVQDISTVSLIVQDDNNNNNNNNNLVTIQRPPGWSEEQIMYMSLGLDKDHNKNDNWTVLAPWQDEDPTLPSREEIQDLWGAAEDSPNPTSSPSSSLMTLDHVEIRRRRDGVSSQQQNDGNDDDEKKDEFVTLLQSLSWDIQPGQRWLIAGPNGAGKSTLSRFLLQKEQEGLDSNNAHSAVNDDDDHNDDKDKDTTRDWVSGTYNKDPNTKIGWVSTESHLGQVVTTTSHNNNNNNNKNDEKAKLASSSAWDVITHNGTVPDHVASQVTSWVFGPETMGGSTSTLLQDTPLEELSQGHQKLALMASALALRPNVLILDEPTQGLDWIHRRRVLALLERLCQATTPDQMSLIYITHYQEEWIPSISHVLHLNQGQAVYQGPKKDYNPDRY